MYQILSMIGSWNEQSYGVTWNNFGIIELIKNWAVGVKLNSKINIGLGWTRFKKLKWSINNILNLQVL